MMSKSTGLSLNGARKAAILISLIGEEAAAPLLRNLTEEDVERVSDEIANLGYVPPEETTRILEEYEQIVTAQEFIALGGRDTAIRLLVTAFGENGARAMVDRLMRPEDPRAHRLEILKKADPQQLAKLLVGEHAQTKTLILAHLDAKQASALLTKLEAEDRADCVKRLANMGQFSPEVAGKVTNMLSRRLRAVGDQSKPERNELKNIAAIMNRLDPLTGREILDSIERDDPKLATNIRDRMFIFEDFLKVAQQDMRELMKSVDQKALIVALKGANEELREHFYRTMSSRAVELMKEDSDVMGPVRSRDVTKAQGEIVAIARQLESEGTIALKTEEDDGYVF